MSNTLIEMQARHQIHERLARASGPGCRPQPPAPGRRAAAPGRRPRRQLTAAATVRAAAIQEPAVATGPPGERPRPAQIVVRWKFWKDRDGVGPRWPW